MKDTKTIKAFSYQSGFLAATPAEAAAKGLPWSLRLFRKTVTRSIEPNLADHEKAMQYIENEGKSDSYATAVIMEGDAKRTLESKTERSATLKSISGVTFKELAKYTLMNVKETSESLSYIWPSPHECEGNIR